MDIIYAFALRQTQAHSGNTLPPQHQDSKLLISTDPIPSSITYSSYN